MHRSYPSGGGSPYPPGGDHGSLPGGGAADGERRPYPAHPPSHRSGGRPPEHGQIPRPIRTAVTLMYAGAGLDLLGLVLGLAGGNHSGANVAASVAGPVIGMALWLWMAAANAAGRSWARVLSTVFFGIDSLVVLLALIAIGALFNPASHPSAVMLLAGLASVGVWILGFATVMLLWRRESSDYYTAMKTVS